MRYFLLLLFSCSLVAGNSDLLTKRAFTNVNLAIPSIEFAMRYAGRDNFIGSPVDGYAASVCYLTNEAADALKKVQQSLKEESLGLIVFDCYRPQRSVDHFVRWAKDLNDTKMKSLYYPDIAKKKLFKKGYIAARSGHSRGSTVDLSIEGFDMGTPFDFFDVRSHTDSSEVTRQQHKNRMKLKQVMEANGFQNYAQEWWHFTLKDEPFSKTYFDFEID